MKASEMRINPELFRRFICSVRLPRTYSLEGTGLTTVGAEICGSLFPARAAAELASELAESLKLVARCFRKFHAGILI